VDMVVISRYHKKVVYNVNLRGGTDNDNCIVCSLRSLALASLNRASEASIYNADVRKGQSVISL